MLCDLLDSATYDDVVFKLRQRYGSLKQIESYRIELKQRKRKPGSPCRLCSKTFDACS